MKCFSATNYHEKIIIPKIPKLTYICKRGKVFFFYFSIFFAKECFIAMYCVCAGNCLGSLWPLWQTFAFPSTEQITNNKKKREKEQKLIWCDFVNWCQNHKKTRFKFINFFSSSSFLFILMKCRPSTKLCSYFIIPSFYTNTPHPQHIQNKKQIAFLLFLAIQFKKGMRKLANNVIIQIFFFTHTKLEIWNERKQEKRSKKKVIPLEGTKHRHMWVIAS